MRRLLVTGAAGFIGANFVHHWAERHPQDRLVALDLLTYAGNLTSLGPVIESPSVRFVQGDIGDEALIDGLMAEECVDTVVHFAAESHVDRSITGPDAFVQTNVVGTHVLLKAARRAWLDGKAAGEFLFHHVSTDEVYGTLGPNDPAFNEQTPYAPNSPYAASKAASDHLVRAYHHTYGLPTTISNCSNNYGPYQFPEKFIPLVILNCLGGKPLPIYGDGQNVRDWLYVEDHCRGIEAVIAKGRRGEAYNIGGNCERPNFDVVDQIIGLIDARMAADRRLSERFPDCPASRGGSCHELIKYVKDRPGHDRRYAIDATKSRAELGYAPTVDFAGGMARTIDWYLANEPWWRAVMEWQLSGVGESELRGALN